MNKHKSRDHERDVNNASNKVKPSTTRSLTYHCIRFQSSNLSPAYSLKIHPHQKALHPSCSSDKSAISPMLFPSTTGCIVSYTTASVRSADCIRFHQTKVQPAYAITMLVGTEVLDTPLFYHLTAFGVNCFGLKLQYNALQLIANSTGFVECCFTKSSYPTPSPDYI